MRGLDTRTEYAKARNLIVSDPIGGNDVLIGVLHRAQADGYHDFNDGISTVPTMFADRPDLVAFWEDGQMKAEQEKTELAEGLYTEQPGTIEHLTPQQVDAAQFKDAMHALHDRQRAADIVALADGLSTADKDTVHGDLAMNMANDSSKKYSIISDPEAKTEAAHAIAVAMAAQPGYAIAMAIHHPAVAMDANRAAEAMRSTEANAASARAMFDKVQQAAQTPIEQPQTSPVAPRAHFDIEDVNAQLRDAGNTFQNDTIDNFPAPPAMPQSSNPQKTVAPQAAPQANATPQQPPNIPLQQVPEIQKGLDATYVKKEQQEKEELSTSKQRGKGAKVHPYTQGRISTLRALAKIVPHLVLGLSGGLAARKMGSALVATAAPKVKSPTNSEAKEKKATGGKRL